MKGFTKSNVISAWYERSERKVQTWEDLARSKNNQGMSLQDFWLKSANPRYKLTDENLIDHGILVTDSAGTLFHKAFIPWVFHDDKLAKSNWTDDQWNEFDVYVAEVVKRNGNHIRHMDWAGLTLSGRSAPEFMKSGIRDSHIVGTISGGPFNATVLSSNLIDGDASVQGPEFHDATVTGSLRGTGRQLRLFRSTVGEIVFNGRDNSQDELIVVDSEVGTLQTSGLIENVEFRRSSILNGILVGTRFGKFLIEGDGEKKVALHFLDSTFQDRFIAKNVEFESVFEGDERSFRHAKFLEKIRLIDADLPLSIMADAQFEAPVDIEFRGKTAEDVFEAELSEVLTCKKSDPIFAESWRRDLERACQLICDRHRQDGRKDMEHRFRRMELKARAYRLGADRGTRVLSRSYDFFSDFGRSFWRPIRGFCLITFAFFIVYWVMGAFALGLPVIGFGQLDKTALVDAGLLGLDKAFPFGVSVNESELFGGKLLGADGGVSAIFVGLLGAVQTVLSGIMIFLTGLAVRTKLLIG